MARVAQPLDTTRVVAGPESRASYLQGFERRRTRPSGGAFLTREEIERRGSLRTIDLIRRMLGVKVIDSAGVLLVASSRGPKTLMTAGKADVAPCVMQVTVDGIPKEWGFSLDLIPPKEIHGIEVYPGPATMPAEFNNLRTDAFCGLVMIWTRVDR